MQGSEAHGRRRVLIIGADGLRPDLVSRERMPTYHALIGRGSLYTAFHSAFPTHTRVNMTTLTTGTRPGRHGVINNTMYVAGAAAPIDTADPKQLLEFERLSGESVVLTPTLGDRLRKQGERLAVAACSTPGASLLWNPRNPQRVLNAATDYGDADLAAVRDKLGPAEPDAGRTKYNACRWAARALIDVLLDQPENRVITLWLTEPDASQHFYGLGSPEALKAMQVVDECVATVLDALAAKGLADEFDLLLVSDHGHSSDRHSGSLAEHLVEAREELDLGDLIAVADFVYSPNGAYDPAALPRLADWLLERPWCGLLFSPVPSMHGHRGVLPLELATGPLSHDRAPLLAVSPTWSHATNTFGVPGSVDTLTSYSPLKSTHGTASPYDMRAFCLGVGPGFAPGVRVDEPCGTVDVAPTVWDLLGHDGPSASYGFDGGSLLTLGADTSVRRERFAAESSREGVEIAHVDGRSYFLGSVAR
ncbi:MAG: alkaline phosphatase family protein [Trueperaceae bacterium]|nr:alkaline phosphatase family protein [Trueperaceae bacterium]